MKFSNLSHKTPHLKGKQHQLDPNLDLKQLVHHATVQYVDRDVDGDVDVYDNPKKKIPDENVSSTQKAQEYSNKLIAKQKGEIKHTKRGMAYEDTVNEEPRIARKPGQPANSKKHSDLYTDENPKGTISGLGFKDVATAKQSVSKIKNSGKTHAHKIQAAVAMEQRAKEMGKSSEAAVFRSFINSMKEKTKEMSEESKKCKSGYYYCYTNKKCKPIPPGFMIDPAGMLAKENGATIDEEGLRAWFGKSKSDGGKPGWVQSDGSPCANEPGETKTPKCFSRTKLASMTKGEIASAVRRKRKQDPGQQSKSGAAKPTYVSTDSPTKKMKKESFNENHKAIADGREKDEEGYMARTEMDTIVSAVEKLRKFVKKGDTQLPAWVQSKITKAADYIDTAADYLDSDEISEESDKKNKGSGTKDACYLKVKSRYSVWPSAYASGALVKCRKVGADSWGNKSESVTIEDANGNEYVTFTDVIQTEPLKPSKGIGSKLIDEDGKKCWPGYKKKGTQKLFGKTYNRCVKDTVNEVVRIPAKTGNIILVALNWRGKYLTIKMFFPQTTRPNRGEVQDQLNKVYPGAKVHSYYFSDINPGEQFLQVEDWQKENRKDKTDGLSQKAVNAYRRENPGSNLQTAVTEKNPSGKRASRRKNFCSRMSGMKAKLTSAKTARDPDSRINKALRRWNCN